MQQLGKGSG